MIESAGEASPASPFDAAMASTSNEVIESVPPRRTGVRIALVDTSIAAVTTVPMGA
jgi:hypothetical protein